MFHPHHQKILLSVLTYYYDFAVSYFSEFVNDQVRVESMKVVKEDWKSKTDRALQVAQAVSGADEESCDVVVVTDLRSFRIVFFKRLAADVAFARVFILRPLLGTHALHWSIRSQLLDYRRLPLDEHVQELGKRFLPHLHHRQSIVIAESRAENGRCGANFVLLRVNCLLYLATERLENKLEVRIDDKQRYNAIYVIVEL